MATLAAAQDNTIFMPMLVYRTGPYAPSGIPLANAGSDYFNLINERDGGINGVKFVVEECETQYDTKQGVECYERMKGKGPLIINPYSTGITYQLIPKAAVDKVVVHSMGYGMTASADGRWFPWVFNFPMTYWSQASAFVKYVGAQEGGMDKLKGKKIVHIFHNSPYGKEANPTLETLSKQLGFDLTLLPVDHPGQEQKATWLQVRRINPDWIYISGWGVMNQVAVKEAAAHGMKMDHVVGNWWTGTEADVDPGGRRRQGLQVDDVHRARPLQDSRGHRPAPLRQGEGCREARGHRRGAVQPHARQRDARRRGRPHGDGQVQQQGRRPPSRCAGASRTST